MFGQDRGELRRMYGESWRKYRMRAAMSPLEAQIAAVISEHPEYHDVVDQRAIEHDWLPEHGETNPFLHMGLHLALREQVATDRPPGISEVYQRLCRRFDTAHAAEHRMMEVLAESLWQAQSRNQPPDEQTYLEGLERL